MHRESGNAGTQAEPVDFGLTIVLGIGAGFALGLILDEIGLGMATGLAVATLVNASSERRRNARNAGRAVAISIGGVVFVVLIWLARALGWL